MMQVVDQPAFSRLSVEAPCFIPANFEQSISSTADEAPSYFNDFVWQETELKDASAYLRLCNKIAFMINLVESLLETSEALFMLRIVLYCIVLYLYIYIALLAVHTNQKHFQCERPREKKDYEFF